MSRVDSSNIINLGSSSEETRMNPISIDSSSNCSLLPSDHHVLGYNDDDPTSRKSVTTSTSSEKRANNILESRNATVERFDDSDLTRCVSNEEETEIEENRNSDLSEETSMAAKKTQEHCINESKQSTNDQQVSRMSLKMLSLTNSGKEDLDAFYNSDIVSLSGTPANKANAVMPTPANFVAQHDNMDKNILSMDVKFASPKRNDLNANSLVFSPLRKLSSAPNSRPRNHFLPPATTTSSSTSNRKRLFDESSTCIPQSRKKKPKVESQPQVHTRNNNDFITSKDDTYTTSTNIIPRRKIQIPEHAKKYGTQLSIEIFQHFTISEFKESDRGCKRSKLPVGTYGFACGYCDGRHGKKRGGRCGRYFPSSLKTLADPNKILFCMYRHLQRCEDCPSESKERLDSAYEVYDEERLGQGRGYQKKFYKEVWRDLHRGRLGNDNEFVIEQQEETQEDNAVEEPED
ncbi:hypothetical protein CTEN210_13212 [Chaetoceros tenuissimus]|uniref:Uncharacterized protein n=1 Tax=Chaetoceros tenuissimus TaxID=426638 RepID=A0AAD3D4R9_9STRA|nr:hypothetical protein CTEN210_13212 [Chaetoceros tenuissimus]